MYRTLFYVNIYGSYKLSKYSPVFFGPPCTLKHISKCQPKRPLTCACVFEEKLNTFLLYYLWLDSSHGSVADTMNWHVMDHSSIFSVTHVRTCDVKEIICLKSLQYASKNCQIFYVTTCQLQTITYGQTITFTCTIIQF